MWKYRSLYNILAIILKVILDQIDKSHIAIKYHWSEVVSEVQYNSTMQKYNNFNAFLPLR